MKAVPYTPEVRDGFPLCNRSAPSIYRQLSAAAGYRTGGGKVLVIRAFRTRKNLSCERKHMNQAFPVDFQTILRYDEKKQPRSFGAAICGRFPYAGGR